MLKKILVAAVAVYGLQACSDIGLLPTSGSSGQVTLPRVILNCQTSHCRTNVNSPQINVVITTSSCADPLFGAAVSSSTRSISCNGTIGCYGEVTNWVTVSGTAATIPPGTYNVCGCIDYTATGTPWVNCNSLGSLNNVLFSADSGLKTVSSWIDQ
jgi:hypothetical protein